MQKKLEKERTCFKGKKFKMIYRMINLFKKNGCLSVCLSVLSKIVIEATSYFQGIFLTISRKFPSASFSFYFNHEEN